MPEHLVLDAPAEVGGDTLLLETGNIADIGTPPPAPTRLAVAHLHQGRRLITLSAGAGSSAPAVARHPPASVLAGGVGLGQAVLPLVGVGVDDDVVDEDPRHLDHQGVQHARFDDALDPR